MTYACANMHSSCTASGDASFAAQMAAVILFVLDIALAVSIFVTLLAKLNLLVLDILVVAVILVLGLIIIRSFAPHRRKNRQG